MPEATTQKDDAGATAASDRSLLTITDEAAERLTEEMDKHEGTQALRLLIQEGCCGFGYAMAMAKRDPEDGERVVESNGVDVYLDDATLDRVHGAEISWNEGVFGAGFAIENPNEPEDAACGCR